MKTLENVSIYTTPQEIAKALNFGKYPVLTWNMDTKKGSKVRVMKQTARYGTVTKNCTLQRDMIKEGDGIFYLSTQNAMLKGNYGWSDHLESAEFANAPIIEPHQKVAVLVYSETLDISVVFIIQAGKIDASYSSATTFEYILDEQ